MKNTEEMADQTARDLFGMVFDESGVTVPPDDLVPAAMAGYRRWRRLRTAMVGAGVSVAVIGVASAALAVAGSRGDGGDGGGKRGGTVPGVWSRPETSTASKSPAPDSDSGHLVDCYSNFAVDGDGLAKARADCTQAERLWQAVFPGDTVGGARNPSFAQITDGFLARVAVQNAAAPSSYGRPQPQVIQDWADARAINADAGYQTWSGFNIATPQGTIIVSGTFRSNANSDSHRPCWGSTPCTNVPLHDTTTAEVGGAGGAHGYTVTVRSPTGDSYQFLFTSHYDPRYVDIPCSAPAGHCYADLTDGSVRPGAVPDSSAIIDNPVVTHAVLMDIVNRPAFADLVKGYIEGKFGQPAVG